MNKRIVLFSIPALFYTGSLWARDALLLELQDMGDYFYGPRYLIPISIFIEAIFFIKLVKGVTPARAFLMALIGNVFSFAARAFVIPLLIMGIEYAFGIPIPYSYNLVIILILTCLGSPLIELGVLTIIFGNARQLFLPVFLGNVVTYIITFIYLKWQ